MHHRSRTISSGSGGATGRLRSRLSAAPAGSRLWVRSPCRVLRHRAHLSTARGLPDAARALVLTDGLSAIGQFAQELAGGLEAVSALDVDLRVLRRQRTRGLRQLVAQPLHLDPLLDDLLAILIEFLAIT